MRSLVAYEPGPGTPLPDNGRVSAVFNPNLIFIIDSYENIGDLVSLLVARLEDSYAPGPGTEIPLGSIGEALGSLPNFPPVYCFGLW